MTWKGDVFASPCPTCSAFSRSYPSFPSCPPHTSPIVTHATEHPGLTYCPQHAPHPVLQGTCPMSLAYVEPQLPPPANVDHYAAATGGSSGLKGKDGAEKRFSGLRIPMTGTLACPPNGPQALGLGQRPHSLAGWLTTRLGIPGGPSIIPHHTPALALLRNLLDSMEGSPSICSLLRWSQTAGRTESWEGPRRTSC